MSTAVLAKNVQAKPTKKSWGLPSQKDTSLEDFRSMIAEAEKEKGYTFDEYNNKVNKWLKSNL
jgi:ABC-type thiamine transport system substrate-binding protein